jgi:hypothetical protein
MPAATMTEHLKQLESVDDSQLLTGYRFLVTSRRKNVARVASKKKAAKKRKVSSINRRSGAKAVSKGR